MNSPYQVFVSGIADLPGTACAVRGGVNICTCAIDVSRTALQKMAEYCNEGGGSVLMDSGAYREFSSGTQVDWDKVLRRYRDFSDSLNFTGRSNVLFVAPDAIGNIEETARRQRAYGHDCRRLQDEGSQIVVPLQFAPEQINREAEFLQFALMQWKKSLSLLGLEHAILGFPARLVTPSPLLIGSLSGMLPGLDGIHLLGCARHNLLTEFSQHAKVPVSGDANILRRFITDELAEQCRDLAEVRSIEKAVDGDDTEWIYDLYNSPEYLNREESDLLAGMLRVDPDEVFAASKCEGDEYGCGLGSMLDEAAFDMWSFSFVRRLAEKFPYRYALAREECLAERLEADRIRRSSAPVQLALFAA